MTSRTVRYYAGIRPPSPDWQEWGRIDDYDIGVIWIIYWQVRDEGSTSKWDAYKVVADGMVQRKANFSILFSLGDGRMFGRDAFIMRQHNPKLFKAFLNEIGKGDVE